MTPASAFWLRPPAGIVIEAGNRPGPKRLPGRTATSHALYGDATTTRPLPERPGILTDQPRRSPFAPCPILPKCGRPAYGTAAIRERIN